ncbi:ferric reductase-like transmembrane domain-containing protein [Arthrobacter sp. GMC3]|uniref:ferredoxin reductase family protein n=1 Tax=Arthrobacter sp. GMC3 TaxID=2058894 RepID=UPI0015E44CD0|nr:ferric reductase-like transmembrane domain-containing protein [Arthrobacter sp. GMC3]
MKNAFSALAWLSFYVLFCIAPLLLALGHPSSTGRSFLIDFSVALGFVGLSMLAFQFVLIARFKVVAAPFGIDALLKFHIQITFVGLIFVVAHPVLLFIADAQYLALLNPVTALWRARFAVLSVLALLVLIGLSVWRKRLRLRYEVWKLTHGLIAVAVVLFGLLHASLVGYFVTGTLRHLLFEGYIGILIFLLVWVRLISPLMRLRRPWRVVEVKPERGNATTLVIAPVGHDGFRFKPGQFGWIAIGRSPFSITQHPFSFSSAADTQPGGSISMTIKVAGDFTETISRVEAGTRVYVDGPHGVFSMDQRQGPGYVLVAGGVGVTPMYSMLLTMLVREDVRPVTLFYASATWEDVVLREELEQLSDRMPNFNLIHVIGTPPPDWDGEVGRISVEMLERRLPAQYRRYEFLICGSTPMMDAMEEALAQVGVPYSQVSSERFDMI